MKLSHVIAVAALLAPAWSAGAENRVRWATPLAVETFDPNASDVLQNSWVLDLVYEALVGSDPEGRERPLLAAGWRSVDPLTWEFDLRAGVRFHDGTPLTVEDVVFSIERARSEGSTRAEFARHLGRIEAVDSRTLRITTAKPNPLIWSYADCCRIISKAWAERHGAELPAHAQDGEVPYSVVHANGTGPFRLEAADPPRGAVLIRNPDWWDSAGHPRDIDRIEQTRVDPARGLEMLLAGDVELLQYPPPEGLERITAAPGLKLEKVATSQVIYLGFDESSPELRTSDVKGKNPFADRRVRQAVYQALDIERIGQALRGLAVPVGMLIWPKGNGWAEELDRRLPYDPGMAKALLAEAGYAEGFRVRLDCTRVREPMCRTVLPMLAEIGIQVELTVQSSGEVGEKIKARTTDFFQWGSTEPFDSIWVFQNRYRSDARAGTGYADPEVDAAIDAVGAEISTYVRDALIERVWRRVLGEVVYVPLYRPLNAAAMRADLDLPMTLTGGPDFSLARFTSPPAR